MTTKITKIEIQIGKKSIRLSLDEARELSLALNELLEKPYTPIIPWTVPSTPWPVEPYYITYDDSSAGNDRLVS